MGRLKKRRLLRPLAGRAAPFNPPSIQLNQQKWWLIWLIGEIDLAKNFHSTSIQKKLLIWLVELEWLMSELVCCFSWIVGYGLQRSQCSAMKRQTNKQTNHSATNQKRESAVLLAAVHEVSWMNKAKRENEREAKAAAAVSEWNQIKLFFARWSAIEKLIWWNGGLAWAARPTKHSIAAQLPALHKQLHQFN